VWKSLRHRFRSALRYRLLALVLLPLLLAMAATLGYTLYWLDSYTLDTLFFTARDDLALARHALRQTEEEYLAELQQLAESPQFRAALREENGAALQRALRRVRDGRGFAFLHVTGVAGNWLYEPHAGSSKPSPLTDRAVRGLPGAALEVFHAQDLRREGPALAGRARVAIVPDGAGAAEERALVLRLVQPLADDGGRAIMALDAAVLLNRNDAALDAIRNRVFGAGTLPSGAEPIVTLLLDDVRVGAAGSTLAGLMGERAPAALRTQVVEAGETWTGRDRLAGHGFVSAYGPLFDVNGQRVGMLHVGFLESAMRASHYRAAALLLALFLTATAAAAWIAVRGVRSIFRPIEQMAAVVRATQAGEDRRIGPVGTHDETGELARQFDAMLELLQQRNHEIQRAALALEGKVAERTQELAHKNTELQATISLLQQTRAQLVLAEKLSALGQMAAGIAHEINNPAAVIFGNLEVLVAELGKNAEPVAREIELIAQQVERIRHIVTSLLQFARSEPAPGPIAQVDVNRVVEDVLPLVTHLLRRKSIVLRKRLAATGTIGINVFDLEQVLINLIANAANAVAEGGAIELTTADSDSGGAVIGVRDNGAGIPPERLPRIFDPFFTTDPRQGVGLGLSVSYGLVRRYGGHIGVESAVGAGSEFRVWLRGRPETGVPPEGVGAMPEGRVAATPTESEEATYG